MLRKNMAKNRKTSSNTPRISQGDQNSPGISWGYGYVVTENVVDYLIGNIMPIIEIMGLPDKQEIATKEQIKQAIRKIFYDDAIFIKPERHNQIREEYYAAKRKADIDCLPTSAI
jgi:hypothetical protein